MAIYCNLNYILDSLSLIWWWFVIRINLSSMMVISVESWYEKPVDR